MKHPVHRPSGRSKGVTMRFNAELLKQINEAAAALGVSRATWFHMAAAHLLARQGEISDTEMLALLVDVK